MRENPFMSKENMANMNVIFGFGNNDTVDRMGKSAPERTDG